MSAATIFPVFIIYLLFIEGEAIILPVRQPAFNFLAGNAHIRNSTAATAANPPAKKNAVAAL
jgi:hypothetical protein